MLSDMVTMVIWNLVSLEKLNFLKGRHMFGGVGNLIYFFNVIKMSKIKSFMFNANFKNAYD